LFLHLLSFPSLCWLFSDFLASISQRLFFASAKHLALGRRLSCSAFFLEAVVVVVALLCFYFFPYPHLGCPCISGGTVPCLSWGKKKISEGCNQKSPNWNAVGWWKMVPTSFSVFLSFLLLFFYILHAQTLIVLFFHSLITQHGWNETKKNIFCFNEKNPQIFQTSLINFFLYEAINNFFKAFQKLMWIYKFSLFL